ncbi:MAG TPA: hypothetical protein VNJ01_04720 [Bacteriovoracaceae bacterium]|nr:hypothetical protein [Bacteriovoracaceae bacterium]
MKILICLLALHFSYTALAQEKEKVIYQYKKYEKFDLGNLEVQGQLIAPGDISVRDRDRKRFELDMFSRKEFDDFTKRDVESLR